MVFAVVEGFCWECCWIMGAAEGAGGLAAAGAMPRPVAAPPPGWKAGAAALKPVGLVGAGLVLDVWLLLLVLGLGLLVILDAEDG